MGGPGRRDDRIFRRELLLAFQEKGGMEDPERLSNLSGEADQVVSVSYGDTEEYLDTIIGR